MTSVFFLCDRIWLASSRMLQKQWKNSASNNATDIFVVEFRNSQMFDLVCVCVLTVDQVTNVKNEFVLYLNTILFTAESFILIISYRFSSVGGIHC